MLYNMLYKYTVIIIYNVPVHSSTKMLCKSNYQMPVLYTQIYALNGIMRTFEEEKFREFISGGV